MSLQMDTVPGEMTGRAVRQSCAAGQLAGPTAGLAAGYVQANLVILPREFALDFITFCLRNRRPCPILEVTNAGSTEAVEAAPGSDLRTDLPRYRVFRNGTLVAEPETIVEYWRDDLVSVLLGCSFSFDYLLLRHGLPVRHVELGCNVPMYRTSIATTPAGVFGGSLVVSMRPMSPRDAIRAVQLTTVYDVAHGAPIHIGDGAALGIHDISKPDYGDAVPVRPDEVPVFWACGVTSHEAIVNAGISLAITHSPGCMFVTDLRLSEL